MIYRLQLAYYDLWGGISMELYIWAHIQQYLIDVFNHKTDLMWNNRDRNKQYYSCCFINVKVYIQKSFCACDISVKIKIINRKLSRSDIIFLSASAAETSTILFNNLMPMGNLFSYKIISVMIWASPIQQINLPHFKIIRHCSCFGTLK